ncbi:MAG: RNA 2',3'-cyclic phosphodiesterase [Actinobacteria bacterium]|nr:RNA 2',3'-cyclic phosphodiesterase [Actinomycetota bacterium]
MRLFVALDLPAQVRAALAAWGDAAAPEAMRRTPAANLHVTLAFLGTRSPADAEAVAAVLAAVAGPVGALEVDGALWLPRGRPGVLTVALRASPALAALHADLEAALAAAIGFVPERRVLAPHVTVARVRRGERLKATQPDPPPALTFAPEALVLYRSRTSPSGARYEALAAAAVDGGAP